MSTNVIKEFLVRLGYKVDSTGERKFVDGVKHVTEEAQKLGLAAAASAAAVAAAVTKMASNLEDLYFMSQRVGATAENIKAVGFAASQMGSSVEGARGSIESLAKFLRENPGGEGLLGSIGVQTRDVNGALRDTTDIMQDIGKRLAGMPQYRAIAYANVFGIDYKTLVALEQGVDKFGNRYKDMLRRFGLNVEDATKKSHELMVSWRDMKAQAGILGTIVGTTLIGAFQELEHRWQSLDQTTKQNIETGAKWVAGIVAGTALIMAGPVAWIAALAAGIVALWDDYQVWKEGGKSLIDWGKWGPEVKLAKAGFDILSQVITELSGDFRVMVAVMEDAYNWISKLSSQIAGNPYVQKIMGQHDFSIVKAISDSIPGLGLAKAYYYTHARSAGDSAASDGATRGIRNNNPGNIKYGDFARRHGATGQDANGFAIFPDAATGLRAINDNLSSYGRQGFNTPSAIAHRWSATDQDAYTQRLASMFGGDPNKALNMADPAVLNALRNAIVLQENGSNPYGREMLGVAAQPTRAGAGALSVDQQVTINLHGVDRPQDAKQAVTDGMNGANDRLVRNLKAVAS